MQGFFMLYGFILFLVLTVLYERQLIISIKEYFSLMAFKPILIK